MLDDGLVGFVGLFARPVAHHVLGVEQVDGELDEHRAGHTLLAADERLFDGGHDLAQRVGAADPYHVGLHQRHLVDVLKRPATAEHGRRCAADEHHGRLRHLSIFHGGDGVGHARPRGDDGDARDTRQARNGVGGERGVHLVTHVDHSDAFAFARDEDRRDMATYEGEHELDTVGFQDLCNSGATIHGTGWVARRREAAKCVT